MHLAWPDRFGWPFRSSASILEERERMRGWLRCRDCGRGCWRAQSLGTRKHGLRCVACGGLLDPSPDDEEMYEG